MASRLFVANEWLLEDLLGTNGADKRRQTFQWLEKLHAKCDRLAVLESSPWAQKAYKLMKQADPATREVSKFLRLKILQNQLKCVLVRQGELCALPADLQGVAPASDEYLVNLYLSTSAELLLTTDLALHDALRATGRVAVAMRDEFLSDYVKA